jgi:hypothetical protein
MLSIILSTLLVSTSPISPTVKPTIRPKVQTQSAASLYRRVKPYVVTVKTSDGTGSGFITDEGLLYTAYHVVRGSTKLSAVTGTGKSIPLKTVIAADVDQDWICFQTAIKGNIHVVKHNNSPVGARITVIGSPKGLAHTINEGLMSGRRAVGKLDRIQLSISGFPGSSGSPVFNGSGDVIGMVTGGATDTETITYAAPASRFVGRRGITAELVSRDLTDEERGLGLRTTYDKVMKIVNDFTMKYKLVDDDAKDLMELLSCNLQIKANDLLVESVSQDSIVSMAQAEIKKSVPRLELLTDEQQGKRLEYWTNEVEVSDEVGGLWSLLLGFDEYYRYLYLPLDLEKVESGYKLSASLYLNRGAVTPLGERYWDAYSDFATVDVADKGQLNKKVKEVVTTLVSKFAEKWNLANPEEEEEKDKQ